ncbi:SAP domain-containing protein [Fulvivirgaceae bacterium BMA10]|uniref:SAP domain-containing protein n=1 Tax=Splendidivirga corallicola TaxID=3051826 RepID=A0ABT8KVI0_9BACT|nr:SAP domain-containing protein [Fulvivirgaceae bacterium BMA10]
MEKRSKLSTSMTEAQFDNGYWYVEEIRGFAREIGIPSASKLRKDELEECIKHFLKTGEIKETPGKRPAASKTKDSEKGLHLELPIINYTNNKETKHFITNEALKIEPDLKHKSGVSYRLNRWREEQINSGKKITYGDLVRQYITLNQVKGSFEQVPHGRYINFLANYLEGEKGSTREQAIKTWKELKELNIPKTYQAWKKYQEKDKNS